jgi:hypothetical protein
MGNRVSKCIRQERIQQAGQLDLCETPRGNHVGRVTLLPISLLTPTISKIRESVFWANVSVLIILPPIKTKILFLASVSYSNNHDNFVVQYVCIKTTYLGLRLTRARCAALPGQCP